MLRKPGFDTDRFRTVQSRLDLLEIWRYVAQSNMRIADRLTLSINARCESIAAMPNMGVAWPEWGTGLQSGVLGRYLIVYRPLPNGIEELRIVHGSRNRGTLFPPGDPTA